MKRGLSINPSPRDRPRARPRRLSIGLLVSLVLGGGLMGCSRQSILSTHSKPAHDIALLWWWMLAAATIVFLGALALLVMAWFRRGTPGLPIFGEREDMSQGMVLLFGIGIPIVALVVLFGVADVWLVGRTGPPDPRTTAMTIDVIGHQWWWEARYDDSRAITANEVHIPTGTRVNVIATTADVIHSFWVPALNRKIDMVPGMNNRVLLETSTPGVYRGQCSQFCGLQHAHMSLYVFAQRPAAFRAWLANQLAGPRPAPSAQAQAGERVFLNGQCASCHRVGGTAAQGTVGPDLTHVASRTSLGGAQIPNTPGELAAWIRNPQAIKPGDRMPDLGLGPTQVSELVSYLDGLK